MQWPMGSRFSSASQSMWEELKRKKKWANSEKKQREDEKARTIKSERRKVRKRDKQKKREKKRREEAVRKWNEKKKKREDEARHRSEENKQKEKRRSHIPVNLFRHLLRVCPLYSRTSERQNHQSNWSFITFILRLLLVETMISTLYVHL